MPTIQNTYEGLPVGTVPTTSNTGGISGTAMSSVFIGAGNEVQAAGNALYGRVCMQFVYGTTAGAQNHFPFPESGRTVFAVPVYFESASTVFDDVIWIRHASGYGAQLSTGADNKLILTNAAGAGISASRAPNVRPSGQWIIAQIARTPGTTTTDGILEFAYFEVGATTPIYEYKATGVNAGTAATTAVGTGRTTGRAQAQTVRYDTTRAQSLASGWIPPYIQPNELPTITLTQTERGVEPGELQDLTATANDPDGTIASLTIAQTGGAPTAALVGSGASRSYKAPATSAGATLTFTATATDNAGAVVTSAIEHTILPAVEYVFRGGQLRPAFRRIGPD